jgi:hypothetical protein
MQYQAFEVLVNLPTIYAWKRKKKIINPLYKGKNLSPKRDILTLQKQGTF